MARNRTQDPQPGVARGQPPPPPPDPSQEWRGTPTSHAPQISRPQPGFCEGPPLSTTSRPPPGVAGNRTYHPQPGVARDHPPLPAARASLEWQGRAHKHLSQEWRAPPPPPSTTTAPKLGVAKDPPPSPTQREGGDGTRGAHRGHRGPSLRDCDPPLGDRMGPS